MSAVTDDRLCWSSIGERHALRDLSSVRSVRWQHRWYAAGAVGIGLALPTAIATIWADRWGGLLVAGFLRAGLTLESTIAVNSLAHLVGRRRYDACSSARNGLLTPLATFGEGSHSYHHRFPFDDRNGVRWWQYDLSKWLIWSLTRTRLARAVRTASPSAIARAVVGVADEGASAN